MPKSKKKLLDSRLRLVDQLREEGDIDEIQMLLLENAAKVEAGVIDFDDMMDGYGLT